MTAERIRADCLDVGDLVVWLDERWYVTSLFIEGSENTMSVDLLRDDDTETGGCHVATNQVFERIKRATL